MFDKTDADKVRYLLSQGIDYERAKSLVVQQKAWSSAVNIATQTANQVVQTPPPAVPMPQQQAPQATPKYNINPSPEQAAAKWVYPLQAPTVSQKISSTVKQFEQSNPITKGIKWGREALAEWFIEWGKTAAKWATSLWKKALGQETDTTRQQDVLDVAEWTTTAAMTAIYPIASAVFGGIAKSGKMWENLTQNIADVNTKIWEFVTKIPWLSNYRASLPETDRQRLDSLVWTRSTLWLAEWVKQFKAYKKQQAAKYTKANAASEWFYDAQGNYTPYPKEPTPSGWWTARPLIWAKTQTATSVATPKKQAEIKVSYKDKIISWVSWLDPRTISIIRSDPSLFKAVDEWSISTDSIKEEIWSIYDAYKGQRWQIGQSYQNFYDPDVTFEPRQIAEKVVSTMRDKGISVDTEGRLQFDLRTVVLKPGEKTAVAEALNIIQQWLSWGPISVEELHNVRRNLYNARQYTDWVAKVRSNVVERMVDAVDEVLKAVPWRAEHDRIFSEKTKFLAGIQKDFFTKNGTFRGNVRPLLNEHHRARLERLEELVPWITQKIQMVSAYADYLRTRDTSKVGTYTKTAIKMLLLGLWVSVWWFGGAIAAEWLSTILWDPEVFVRWITRNGKAEKILDKIELDIQLSTLEQQELAAAVAEFQDYAKLTKAEKKAVEAQNRAMKEEQAFKRKMMREGEPKPVTMKTTEVTPEWVSKQDVVVAPAKQTKPIVTVTEKMPIVARKKPVAEFEIKSDIAPKQTSAPKAKDKSMERLIELDTDPSFEKVTLTEPIAPKARIYETPYGQIDSVFFDRTVQKVKIWDKIYDRLDLQIYKKLTDAEVGKNKQDLVYDDLRGKLQEIKSGKTNRLSWSQLVAVMDELGIESINDIPDESLQDILDMVRSRTAKPNILAKKENTNIIKENTLSNNADNAQDNSVWSEQAQWWNESVLWKPARELEAGGKTLTKSWGATSASTSVKDWSERAWQWSSNVQQQQLSDARWWRSWRSIISSNDNTVARKRQAAPIVEDILSKKNYSTRSADYTAEEKAILKSYWWKGSVSWWWRAILNQFYTPKEVIDVMRDLAKNYVGSGRMQSVLEPAVWTGRFLENVPDEVNVIRAYEIDRVPGTIAQILYPNANVEIQDFTDLFMDWRFPIRRYTGPKYDVVIGNPPYEAWEHKNKWLWLEVWLKRFEDFFVKKWIEMLTDRGVLVYIVPQSTANRIIASKRWSVRRIINLPRGVFPDTQVDTQIVVVQKYNPDLWTAVPEDIGIRTQWTDKFGKSIEYLKSDNPLEALKDIKIESRDTTKVSEWSINSLFDFEDVPAPIIEATTKASKQVIRSTNKKPNRSIMVWSPDAELIDIVSGMPDERILQYQKDTNVYGYIDNIDRWSQSVAYANNDPSQLNIYDWYVYTNETYLKGNLYDKLDKLEQDKNEWWIPEELYRKQKDLIESVLPKAVTINDIKFSVNDKAVMRMLTNEQGKNWYKSVTDLFFERLDENKVRGAYVSTRELKNYIRWGKVDKEIKLKVEAEADNAFNRFIAEGLSPEIKTTLEKQYNRAMRSTYIPDYLSFPLSVKWIGKVFNGEPLKLRNNQIEAINFLNYKWAGIMAHGVWHGKTLEAVLAVENAMQQGKAKKPLIIVPTSILQDKKWWIDTIAQVLPARELVMLWGLWVGDIARLTEDLGPDPTQWVKEWQIGITTYEWLGNLSFSPQVEWQLLASIRDAIAKDTDTEKQAEAQEAKMETVLWQGLRGKELFFDQMWFDLLAVDEAHNFKNLFSNAVSEVDKVWNPVKWVNRYGDLQWSTSLRAKKLYLASQWVMQNNFNRNVYLFTATPFNNSPLEVYNMLSYVGRARLDEMGILNMNDFFPKFADFQEDRVIKANNNVEISRTMKSWKNKPELQAIMFEHLNFKPDNPELVKPENKLMDMKIQMSPLQQGIQRDIIDTYMNSSEPGQLLVGISEARANSLSPYFTNIWKARGEATPTPLELVQNSPKIALFWDIMKQVVKDWLTDWAVFYSEFGEKEFPMIADGLSEYIGIPREKIGILWWSVPAGKRWAIVDKYNKWEYQILIASKVIKEGINLQKNWYIFYDTQIDRNPTGQTQKMGRQRRFGNKRNFVVTVLPLVENSLDSFMLQKRQEKQDRISDLFTVDGQREGEIQGLDPAEQKYALITDVDKKTKLRIDIENSKINDSIKLLNNQIDEIKSLQKALETEQNNMTQHEATIKRYTEQAANNSYYSKRLEDEKKEQVNTKKRLQNKEQALVNRWISDPSNVLPYIEAKQKEINLLEEQKKTIEIEAVEKRREFENEKIRMERERRSNEDYANDIAELNQMLEYHDVASLKELMDSWYTKQSPEKRAIVSSKKVDKTNSPNYTMDSNLSVNDSMMKEATIINKDPIQVYRWEWKGISNATYVKWQYYADSEKFASTFGEVKRWQIPANSKIFNFDIIKDNESQNLIPKELLVDPDSLTQYLIDKWFTVTKNTNSRWVEYVLLNTDEGKLINLARKSITLDDFKEKLLSDTDLATVRTNISQMINKWLPVTSPAYKHIRDYIRDKTQKIRLPWQPSNNAFHWWTQVITQFDISKAKEWNYGKWIYLTDSPKLAEYYWWLKIKAQELSEMQRGSLSFPDNKRGIVSRIDISWVRIKELNKPPSTKDIQLAREEWYDWVKFPDTLLKEDWDYKLLWDYAEWNTIYIFNTGKLSWKNTALSQYTK